MYPGTNDRLDPSLPLVLQFDGNEVTEFIAVLIVRTRQYRLDRECERLGRID